MKIRTFSEMIKKTSFEERFQYLRLDGVIGVSTFGFDRYLNQQFYKTRAWKQTRDYVIARDFGCDLAVRGYEIHDKVLVHHMNPITVEDIIHTSDYLLDADFLVCVSHQTHNAIHYGDANLLKKPLVERKPGDTTLWGKVGHV